MIRDIYATSMQGTFETRQGERLLETGIWSYRGHDNAEVELSAEARMPEEEIEYAVRIHGSELQIGKVYCSSLVRRDGGEERRELHAEIIGREVRVSAVDADGRASQGSLSVPDDTVYHGPSPIWLIHLCMTAPPAADRQVVTPVVVFDALQGPLEGGFFRVNRVGNDMSIEIISPTGESLQRRRVLLADDGCPTRIECDGAITDIVRIPVHA